MPTVLTAHTADLPRATLTAARALLYDVFEDMAEHDWEHALGGIHVVVEDGADLVAHASVVQRRLLHGGRALRAGYVEGVAVRADHRGHGHGRAVMESIERIVRGGYEIGALGTTDSAAPFYAARGWTRWRGRTFALTPAGVVRTPDDDGGVHVLLGASALDVDGDLTCDWREGDVW